MKKKGYRKNIRNKKTTNKKKIEVQPIIEKAWKKKRRKNENGQIKRTTKYKVI